MMNIPKRIARPPSLILVGILIVSVVGCGGGGGVNGGSPLPPSPPPPASSSYAGVAYAYIQGCGGGVGAIVPGHRSAQTAESAARQLCQGEASRLAAQVGGTIVGCETVWTNECVALYGGINSNNYCTVSGAHGNSASAARSNALRDCRNSLGPGSDCEIMTAGCAYSGSPLTGVWRPGSGSTQPPPQQPPSQQPPSTGSSRPIQNFNVTLSSSCFQQVQICVSDHQCEDGDAIQVTVNGGTVFSGELFDRDREQCRYVPIRTGTNSIQLFALNGTGFKGQCSHADVNTGEIRVIGSNTVTQIWRHRGGAGSSANLNISVGPPGGSCP